MVLSFLNTEYPVRTWQRSIHLSLLNDHMQNSDNFFYLHMWCDLDMTCARNLDKCILFQIFLYTFPVILAFPILMKHLPSDFSLIIKAPHLHSLSVTSIFYLDRQVFPNSAPVRTFLL